MRETKLTAPELKTKIKESTKKIGDFCKAGDKESFILELRVLQQNVLELRKAQREENEPFNQTWGVFAMLCSFETDLLNHLTKKNLSLTQVYERILSELERIIDFNVFE